MLTIDQQIALLERRLEKRWSFWGSRRRDAHAACRRLIVLREHVLFGFHEVAHAGKRPPISNDFQIFDEPLDVGRAPV